MGPIIATVVYPLTEKSILLGYKKTGPSHLRNRYNGFGGTVEANESIEEAAIRELQEECEIFTLPAWLVKVGVAEFHLNGVLSFIVHFFLARHWNGTPRETREMVPELFPIENPPYDRMLPADKFLLPAALRPRNAPYSARIYYTRVGSEMSLAKSVEFLNP